LAKGVSLKAISVKPVSVAALAMQWQQNKTLRVVVC
jgi:hypothetical protein